MVRENSIQRVVMKFGGSSVGTAAAIGRAADIVSEAVRTGGQQPIVVVSALAGVTDLLLEGARAAAAGHPRRLISSAKQVRYKHTEAANTLSYESRDSELQALERLLNGFLRGARALSVAGELSAEDLDGLLSTGELMSSRLLAAALKDRGLAALPMDGANLIQTDALFGNARPQLEATRGRIRSALLPALHRGAIPVVAGYTGSTADGRRTTLGRGGSDLSATTLGALLPADRVQIWTDVDGVMSADPRLIPAARSLPAISYGEIEALSAFGAKVMQPAATAPLRQARRSFQVRNTFNPSHPGTAVSPQRREKSPRVLALATVPAVSCLQAPSTRGQALENWLAADGARTAVGLRPPLHIHYRGVKVDLVVHRADVESWLNILSAPNGRLERGQLALVTAVGAGISDNLALKNEILVRLLPVAGEAHALPPGRKDGHLSYLVPASALQGSLEVLHDWLLGSKERRLQKKARPKTGQTSSKEVA